jgi:hypothetical protein
MSLRIFTNGPSKFGITEQYKINSLQLKGLVEVKELHSRLLAEKEYEKISTHYEKYIHLLSVLRSIKTIDPKIMLLIQIAQNTLIGSMNTVSLYSQFTYNEVMILKLNKQIDDILSNKNVIKVMNSANGLISMAKTFTLSPLFSNYIFIYGMPAYGDGFDPVKLTFLKNISTNYISNNI